MVSDMETEEQEARVEDLVGRDWTDDVDVDGGRSLRAAIANAMVGLKKQYYGKGPTKAKTYINDSYVFCVMEGGLTRNEETLVHAGHERVVRDYRLTFQDVMAEETTTAIARSTSFTPVESMNVRPLRSSTTRPPAASEAETAPSRCGTLATSSSPLARTRIAPPSGSAATAKIALR
jgi:uncharacterized protein YbcI